MALAITLVVQEVRPRSPGGDKKKYSHHQHFLLLLTLTSFAITLFVQRAIEFFLPFSILLIFSFIDYQVLSDILMKLLGRHWKRAIIGFLALAIILSLQFYTRGARSLPPSEYRGASEFLIENSLPQEIIFNYSYANYPQLVFFNNVNRYTMGLDTMFTYAYDSELYWLWHHLTLSGTSCTNEICSPEQQLGVYRTLTEYFNASYVFIDESLPIDGLVTFRRRLEADGRFELVYEDLLFPYIKLYEVTS